MSKRQHEQMEEDGAEEWTVCTGEEDYDHRFNVRRLRFAPNITSIGEESFEDCTELREIDLCNVAEIGELAFANCNKLTAVDLSQVTNIGERSFCECRSLRSIRIPPSVAELDWCAFEKCTGLVKVEICAGLLEEVGGCAFEGCTSLEQVIIPSTVVALDEGAFENCSGLISVDLPEGLKTIGDRAFEGCTSLESINIPSTLTELGSRAFHGCKSLISIDLPEGLEAVRYKTFKGCTSLKSIAIPTTNLNSLGLHAFENCSGLVSIGLPEGLKSIREAAIRGCSSLEHIKIPSTVIELSSWAFNDCHNLSNVELTRGGILTFLGRDFFRGCDSLDNIRLPCPSFVVSYGANYVLECHSFLEGASLSPERLVHVVSKNCVKCMSPNQLTEVEGKINEILRQDQTRILRHERIRVLFDYYELLEATSLLELAIWKASIGSNVDQDRGARQGLRESCGQDMQIIIGGVLMYLN